MENFGPMIKLEEISNPTELVAHREGERKIGASCFFFSKNWQEEMTTLEGKFVLVFVSEDIGPRDNLGKGGSVDATSPVLRALLNVQENQFLCGSQLGVLGTVMVEPTTGSVQALRDSVADIDQYLQTLFSILYRHHKVPIVVGGGHNNCFPLIQALAEVFEPVSVLNIDPHADFRALEGRHSGNGFSYAHAQGALKKYALFGLHQNYNSQTMLSTLAQNPEVFLCTFYDDWLMAEAEEKNHILAQYSRFLETSSVVGFEFDLDSIAHFPTSAQTPSGFSVDEARKLIRFFSKNTSFRYFHLPEGHFEAGSVWCKAITYLITDFIKMQA